MENSSSLLQLSTIIEDYSFWKVRSVSIRHETLPYDQMIHFIIGMQKDIPGHYITTVSISVPLVSFMRETNHYNTILYSYIMNVTLEEASEVGYSDKLRTLEEKANEQTRPKSKSIFSGLFGNGISAI